MANIYRDHSRSTSTPIQSTPENQKSYQIYEVTENSTTSKSLKSKLKNFAYTLSRPFRFLMKMHIENSIGARNSAIAIKDIKGPITSTRTTQAASARSPKTSENTHPPSSEATYEIAGGKGGFGCPTLAEKLWPPKPPRDLYR
jgi:hypothetical protein